jgi:hypothetical protein
VSKEKFEEWIRKTQKKKGIVLTMCPNILLSSQTQPTFMKEWRRVLGLTAVKDLYLSEKIVPLIAPVLQELVGEKVTEVLPALQCLLLEGLHTSGPVLEAISPFISFITAREQSTHPIVASYGTEKRTSTIGGMARIDQSTSYPFTCGIIYYLPSVILLNTHLFVSYDVRVRLSRGKWRAIEINSVLEN